MPQIGMYSAKQNPGHRVPTHLRSMARARQNSWRWPSEKLAPPSTTLASSFSSRPLMAGLRPTLSKACGEGAEGHGCQLRGCVVRQEL